MSTRVVELANFMGGEYNLKGEIHAGAGSFTATNMIRLIDGSLCPRSGLVDFAPTSSVTGTVLGFGYHAAQTVCWYIIANHVYQFAADSVGAATATLNNTLAATPVHRVRSAQNTHSNSSWVAILGDQVYDFNHVTPAINVLTGSPAARICEVNGDRLMAGGTIANPERLYYSAAADFTSWPAANYLDVGYGFLIEVLSAYRQGLTIAKQDKSWWLLSGTPGVNDVLRQLHRTIGPGGTTGVGISRWGRSGDGRIWFVPQYMEAPVVATGAAITPFEYMSFTNDGSDSYSDTTLLPAVGVTGLDVPTDVLISTGGVGGGSAAMDNLGLLFSRGQWTKHTFAKNISGFNDGRLDVRRRAFFCDGGGASAVPKFYSWSYSLNRPPFSGKTWESKTDAGTAFTSTVTLVPFYVNEPGPVKLKAIAVEMQAWNHGFGGNNTLACSVTSILRDGSDLGTLNATTYAASAGLFSATGTVLNHTFDVSSAEEANGFRVSFPQVFGIAVRRVYLIFETHLAVSDSDSA